MTSQNEVKLGLIAILFFIVAAPIFTLPTVYKGKLEVTMREVFSDIVILGVTLMAVMQLKAEQLE